MELSNLIYKEDSNNGATERLFKSSNKKIIDSNSIIPYNEKKDNILHNIS